MKKIIAIMITFVFSLLFISDVSALEDGIYTISSSIDTDYSLDISGAKVYGGNNILLYNTHGRDNQKWRITKKDNYYIISSYLNNNYVIDLPAGIVKNSAKMTIYNNNNGKNQRWIIKNTDSDNYSICSYINEKYCLDIQGGKIAGGVNTILFQYHGGSNQKFKLIKENDGEKSVEDGIYTISPSVNSNLNIDLPSSLTTNNTSINLFNVNNGENQKWNIKYLNDGYYKITSLLNDSKAINVYNSSTHVGNEIAIFDKKNIFSQEWIIKDAGDGYYYLISNCGERYLTADGSKLRMYTFNNKETQKFKLTKTNNAGTKTIENGYYFISSSLNINNVFDISSSSFKDNTSVSMYTLHSGLNQKWHIVYDGNGYYNIYTGKNDDLSLAFTSNGIKIGANNDSDNQKWVIRKSDNRYSIISKENNKALQVNGYDLLLGNYIAAKAQIFVFRKTNPTTSLNVGNGLYRLISAVNPDMSMDVQGGTAKDGANIISYTSHGRNNQKWKFVYDVHGYYKIYSVASITKSLDISGGSTNDGANVELYASHNALNQQWILKEASDGYYYITTNNGDKYLTTASANPSSNVNMKNFNGSKNQQWKLVPIEQTTRVIDVSAWQKNIDWAKVAKSGIYGVIIKAGSWVNEDSYFKKNLEGVKKHNIPYGIYWFSYSNTTNGANSELNATKNVLKKYDLNPTLGIYYDIEEWKVEKNGVITDSSYNTSKDMYDRIAKVWIEGVSNMYNNRYNVKIYADLNHYKNRFGPYCQSKMGWIAQWSNKLTYTGPYDLWQYTSKGSVDGISGNVDISYLH